MDAVAKEQWALAILTARFDCAQQKFFQAEYGRRRRSPAVALALCLTLGAFGAHEFYLGRLRSAALRLLFCWTLIPLALALIEASFLTQRVHAYNTRVAHTLAEIVEETFAAVREQPFAPTQPLVAKRPASPAPSAWRVGVARTFAAPAGIRWRQDAPPTVPLAEERIVPVTEPQTAIGVLLTVTAEPAPALRAAPTTRPLPAPFDQPAPTTDAWRIDPTEPLDAPVFTSSTPLSRRERARLGPSLDALLDDLTQLADDTETQRASQREAAPVSPPSAAIEETAPPTPSLNTAPVDTAPADHPVDEADPLDLQPPAPPVDDVPAPVAPPTEDYAKMMATDEPLAAIMGAEPASASVAPAVGVTPSRVQRIIVRKVAMVDGQIVAEAKASRDVVISDADDAEARIAAATDEARDEAMRLLATLVPAETLAQAHGA